jgi:O-antigen/teichoic acid export membrane protein
MEVKKRLVLLNVTTSGAQVVFIGLVYFLLYRYLLSRIGVELLGVWSVVLSTSSLANLANFGVADSVVRFVALYTTDGNNIRIKQLIFTASLFLLLLFILIATVIYPCAHLILKTVLPEKFIHDGLTLLPFSLVCLIINAINGVYASVLDGMQKNYIRNAIFSCSSILLLVGAYLLVPKYHLIGVAIAQIAQSVFTLITCLVIIIIRLKYNPFKWNWDKPIFKQIFSYGMKFQFISLAAMLNEPLTKIFLGKFGGMAFAGYYEMANRLLMQARGIIVSATQSLVPVMVNLGKNDIAVFYRRVFSNILFFALSIMGIIAISSRLISFYWIGSYQPVFCYTLILLALSLFINLLNAPPYFYYMASGNLNILIKTHIILGVLNLALSYVFGYFWGGCGVVYGWFFSVLISSFYLIGKFNTMYNVTLMSLFKNFNIVFITFIIGAILINHLFAPSIDFRLYDAAYLIIMGLGILYIFFKYYFNNFRNSAQADV